MVGFFLGWLGSSGRGRAIGVGEVKLAGQVRPGIKEVVYGVDIKRVMRSKLVLGIADGWLSARLQRVNEAAGHDAGSSTPEVSVHSSVRAR